MIQLENLEVTNVSRVIESTSGKTIYSVQFGRSLDTDAEILKYLPPPQASKPPKKIFENVMSLYFDSPNAAPYLVGSKWRIDINEDGELTLSAMR